jgi:hypothetical protein
MEMLWEKGQSGNPGGRPKENEALKRLILENTKNGKVLVDKLLLFIDHAPEVRDRIAALKILLEYGFGKPVHNMTLGGADGEPVQIVVNTGVPQPDRATRTVNN